MNVSKRELQCLEHVAQGLTNAQIGRQLGLSEASIKNYLIRLYRKLGARGRAHAVARAFELRILPLPPVPTPERSAL